jgi:trans-aconitate methyltransferase
MRQADAVVSGVNRALKPGGRFVGEFAGARNAHHIRNAIHNALTDRGIDFTEIDPWYLPTAEEYALALQNGGLSVKKIELFDRPIVIGYSIEDWITIFGSPYLTVLPEKARGKFLKEVSETLRPHLLTKDGFWIVDYTRIRFRAEKPK